MSTIFLKLVILFIAIVLFIIMMWFPQAEGRAANLDLISIYTDPFIIYIYIGTIPFFLGLYQMFRILNLIDDNKAFSQQTVKSLRNIKLSSLSLIGFIVFSVILIRLFTNGDDTAGPTMLGVCMTLAFSVVATAAAVFQKLFQRAVDIKSENDLTV